MEPKQYNNHKQDTTINTTQYKSRPRFNTQWNGNNNSMSSSVSNLNLRKQHKQQMKEINTKINALKSKMRHNAFQNNNNNNVCLKQLEIKRQRTIKEFEKLDFDYYMCRGPRKYLKKRINQEICNRNHLNIPQRKKLFKALNKERKIKHKKQLLTRDRLKEIMDKHGEKMKEICRSTKT